MTNLTPKQQKCIADFKVLMESKVIPEIVAKVKARQRAAAKNRHRILY